MLAMVVNANAYCVDERGASKAIASKLCSYRERILIRYRSAAKLSDCAAALNNRTSKHTSCLAILMAPQLSLEHRATSAKLPTPALRTTYSILLKLSIRATINLWFRRPIAFTTYLPFGGH
jgi:hypothetical protein